MSKPIKSEELIDPKVIKDLKELIEILQAARKAKIALVKGVKERVQSENITGKDAAKNISDFSKEIKKAGEEIEELTKSEKEFLKLQERLLESTTDQGKENAKLRVEIQETNKSNKQAAREALNLVGAYEKQSKRLIALRKEYKDLVTSEGKATRGSKKLLREITKLDKELKDVDESAGQFQRNVGNYPNTLGNAASSILGVAAAALTAKASFDSVKTSLESNQEGSEDLRKVSSGLEAVFSKVKNTVASFVLDVVDLGKAISKGSIIALSNAVQFKRTGQATEDFKDDTLDLIDAQVKLTETIIQFEKDVRPLEVRLSVLNGLIAQQQIIAGDSTRSFDTLAAAILKSQSLQVERAGINVRIAKEELEVNRERIRIAELAGGASVDLLDQETAAITRVIDAENQLKNEVLENEKEQRQIKQDRLEIELDILIDGFDNQKTINERIIANDRETLAIRAALFQQTVDLANKSFEGQKRILEDLSKAGIDVEDLLALDATELAKEIRLLEQSEIINTRTLEVIRERRIVLQDLEDAQEELNEAEREGIEIGKDIIAQEEALAALRAGDIDALVDLEDDRHQIEIANLRERLEVVKAGSLEELRLNQQLNDALLQQEEKRIEEEKKLEQQLQEIRNFAVDSFIDAINDKADKAIEAADEEIDATEAQISKQEALAAQGLENSLAFEQEQRAEALLQKIEAEKQKERAEKISAFWNLLTNSDSVQEAITKFGIGEAFARTIEALPGLEEGGLTPDNETVIRVSEKGREFVMSHAPTEKYLPQLQAMNTGTYDDTFGTNYIDNSKFLPQNVTSTSPEFAKLTSQMKRVEKAIDNSIPRMQTHYDSVTEEIVNIYTYLGGKKRIVRQKMPRLG